MQTSNLCLCVCSCHTYFATQPPGVITTTVELDREVPALIPTLDIEITLQDGPTKNDVKTLDIDIEDINEPHFLAHWATRVALDSTNTPIGSTVCVHFGPILSLGSPCFRITRLNINH